MKTLLTHYKTFIIIMHYDLNYYSLVFCCTLGTTSFYNIAHFTHKGRLKALQTFQYYPWSLGHLIHSLNHSQPVPITEPSLPSRVPIYHLVKRIILCLAHGHTCYDLDSHPHSAEQKHHRVKFGAISRSATTPHHSSYTYLGILSDLLLLHLEDKLIWSPSYLSDPGFLLYSRCDSCNLKKCTSNEIN